MELAILNGTYRDNKVMFPLTAARKCLSVFSDNFFLKFCKLLCLHVYVDLFQPDGEDDLKKRQLMELAIINGTYRDTTKPTTTQSTQPSVSRKSVSALDGLSLG